MSLKRFDPSEYKRGDSVTVTDGDTVTTINYEWGDADPDVFGDGSAYSIITYPSDIGEPTFDHGVMSGYETPGDVADDLLGDKLWVITNHACDCATTADLAYWLAANYEIDVSYYVMAARLLATEND